MQYRILANSHLLCSCFRLITKVYHILPSIREQLLAKALEVPVNQCKNTCNVRSARSLLFGGQDVNYMLFTLDITVDARQFVFIVEKSSENIHSDATQHLLAVATAQQMAVSQ